MKTQEQVKNVILVSTLSGGDYSKSRKQKANTVLITMT